jgi:hypothetical protein
MEGNRFESSKQLEEMILKDMYLQNIVPTTNTQILRTLEETRQQFRNILWKKANNITDMGTFLLAV